MLLLLSAQTCPIWIQKNLTGIENVINYSKLMVEGCAFCSGNNTAKWICLYNAIKNNHD